MTREELVRKVWAFNRFYMPSMNLLGNHYLGSEYSAVKARIFFEIYQNEGCTAASIAQTMNIDKGYLSRILVGHEKNGYVKRVPSGEDGRSYQLYLTDAGKQLTEEFIEKSNEEIGCILQKLSEEDIRRMAEAIDTITEILNKGNGGEEQ